MFLSPIAVRAPWHDGLRARCAGHRRFRPCVAAAVGVALGLLPAVLGGQAVSGQLSLLEKPGVRSSDLANAVIWLESPVTGGSTIPREPATMVMEGKQFLPHVQVVGVGGMVDYPNHDPFRHNVFSKSGPAEFDLGLYARGDTRRMRFDRAGVYPIFCNIHAKMVAYVVAVPSPYLVRPGVDGRFTFATVPAGSYTLKVWHARGGLAEKPISVAAGAITPVTLELDARSYQFVQHKNKFGANYTISGSERY